jgi:uncharacterized protein (TIGR02271 family)
MFRYKTRKEDNSMPLFKLKDFDPQSHETLGGEGISNLDVYTQGGDKIGSVEDALVDDTGRFRYLVVDTGMWILGKKVLLPIGLAQVDYNAHRVTVNGLSKEQVEKLPEYKESMTVDYDYEEKLRGTYRPLASTTTANTVSSGTAAPSYNRDTYNYEQDQSLYNLNEQNHKTLKLYEERLVATKSRVKTGEVTVGKHVETETARVSVPVEKERVVIERTTPANAGTPVSVGEADFQEGEVARIEVFEETPDIHKEAFVREEVRVRKEVSHDTVEAQETVRREELDVNTGNRSVLDK